MLGVIVHVLLPANGIDLAIWQAQTHKCNFNMKLKKTDTLPPLEKGQLWSMKEAQVEIMDVGKTLAHYRLLQNQKRTPTNLGKIEMVQDYLRSHHAKLIKNERLARPRV
jgi:hypothetical protein